MTAKEKLLQRVTRLSEDEAGDTLRLLEEWRPGDIVDEWGNLSKAHEIAFGESMKRLAARERAAGHEPW